MTTTIERKTFSAFMGGEKKMFRIVTESQEGYNDPELHAWIPPLYKKYLECINGQNVPRNDCEVFGDRIVVSYDDSDVTYERAEPSSKRQRFDEACDEFNSLSATQQLESYVESVEGFDYEAD